MSAKMNITFDVIKRYYFGTLNKYVVIKGRARRFEFWNFFICNMVLGLIPFIGQLIGLLTFIPGITVGVRRLHDINRSGKWILLAYILLLPTIFFVVLAFVDSSRFRLWIIFGILFPLVTLVILIVLIVWAFKEGDRGSNHYGPNPKTAQHSVKRAPARKPAKRKK